MGFVKEFREFALKGNVIDLAIGIVIGAAFGKIVSSLVDDIITPAILKPALKAAHLTELNQLVIPGTAIKYGNFVSQLISFTIVAFALFLLVKGINRMKRKEVAAPVEPTPEQKLLAEIRDLLKTKNSL
jgi:large conductance mechanosensitive channel